MFLIHAADDGRNLPHEHLACGAITPKVGMALYLDTSTGYLALCNGTTVPEYISVTNCDSALTAGDCIDVVKVDEDVIWETEFSASAASIKIGNKVTIASDGLRVTATTSSGVAEVVYMDGTASGSMCRVRFRQ